MNKSLLPLVGTLTAALMATSMSFALPITGSLDFSGGAKFDGTTLDDATKVLSWTSVNVTPLGVTVGSALDTTINPGDSVSMTNAWTFGAGTANLWTVGGFTFDLGTSTVIFQDVDFLSIKGTGVLTGNGYDSTPGSWFFTSQGRGIGEGNFSFSATTRADAASVPDAGASGLLFGSALAGLAWAKRRQKRSV
ncbi:MAG: hypothetical protein JNJ82_07680 [Opitutaceae bacterium]|nr:hypothetical protein [Opitutaceae bacterium]